MVKLLWTAALSGLVVFLGLLLVLRWLGGAGLRLPGYCPCLPSRRVPVSRKTCGQVFAAALLFRIIIFLAAGAWSCMALYPGGGAGWMLDVWKKWDAWHYVNLAELGYGGYVENGQHLFLVFFPLYPWLVRLVSLLVGNTMAAGLLVSFLCFSGGCVYFYKLAAWELGEGAARRALVFLSLFPYSFFFGGVMTESLFLLTTAAALWYIRRHQWWAAGGWGVLAALTRMHGLLLIGAAMAELVEHLGGFRWREIFRRLPALLLPALGTLGYLLLNWQVTGDPFAFTEMQKHWSQGFCWISDTLWYVLDNALHYPTVSIRYEIWIPTLLLFPLFFALMWWAKGRFRSMYTLYAFVCLVLNYSLSWLLSAGRYLSCALPFFLFAAALAGEHRRLAAPIAFLSALGFLAALWAYLTGGQIM